MKLSTSFVACLLALVAAAPALGNIIKWDATLDGSLTGSSGTGSVVVSYDDLLFTLRVQANFSGLTSNDTAAHIHCCTTVANTGNIGVATQLPSFAGFPLNVTAGNYDQTFDVSDLSGSSSFNPSFITLHGGTVGSARNALLVGMDEGKAYFNIHTSQFPAGEIRGFLHCDTANPCDTIPTVSEPGTLTLLGLCLAGLAASRRRKH